MNKTNCIDNSLMFEGCMVAKAGDLLRFSVDKSHLWIQKPTDSCKRYFDPCKLEVGIVYKKVCAGRSVDDKILARGIGVVSNWYADEYVKVRLRIVSMVEGSQFCLMIGGESTDVFVVRKGDDKYTLRDWFIDEKIAKNAILDGNTLELWLDKSEYSHGDSVMVWAGYGRLNDNKPKYNLIEINKGIWQLGFENLVSGNEIYYKNTTYIVNDPKRAVKEVTGEGTGWITSDARPIIEIKTGRALVQTTGIKLICDKLDYVEANTVKVSLGVPCDIEDDCYEVVLLERCKKLDDDVVFDEPATIATSAIVVRLGILKVDSLTDWHLVSFGSADGDFGWRWYDKVWLWQGRLPIETMKETLVTESVTSVDANGYRRRGQYRKKRSFEGVSDLLSEAQYKFIDIALSSEILFVEGEQMYLVAAPRASDNKFYPKQMTFELESKNQLRNNTGGCGICNTVDGSMVSVIGHTFDVELWLEQDDERSRFDVGSSYIEHGRYKLSVLGHDSKLVKIKVIKDNGVCYDDVCVLDFCGNYTVILEKKC